MNFSISLDEIWFTLGCIDDIWNLQISVSICTKHYSTAMIQLGDF